MGDGGRGTRTEIGFALASGKPVLIWLEESEEPYTEYSNHRYPCAFDSHPNVRFVYGPHTVKFLDHVLSQMHKCVKDFYMREDP